MFGAPTPGFDGEVDRRTSFDGKGGLCSETTKTITAEAQAALDLLAELEKRPDHAMPAGVEDHIATSKGLVFQTFVKAGIGLGYSHAHGFVIFKKPGGGWSAPSFIRSKGLSVGFTLGYTKISTLICLHSDRAVQRIKHSSDSFNQTATVGVDFNLSMVTRGRNGRSSLDFSSTDATGFAVDKGLIADLSLKGTELHHDNDLNAAVYTSVVSLDHILGGQAPPPRAFSILYNKIDKLACHEH